MTDWTWSSIMGRVSEARKHAAHKASRRVAPVGRGFVRGQAGVSPKGPRPGSPVAEDEQTLSDTAATDEWMRRQGFSW